MTRLARFTLATVAITFALVTVGGLVRASDSGLGCGDDWPRCYGHVVPPTSDFEATLPADRVPDPRQSDVEIIATNPDGTVTVVVPAVETWIEYTHRALGVTAGLMTMGVLVGAVRRRRGDPVTWRLGRWLLPLIIAQGLLGAYVVNQELQAWTVVAHLAMAMTYVAVLLALAVHLVVPSAREDVDRRLVRMLAASAAGVFGLNLLGSYVTGRHAGLAFDDWPLMDGTIVPARLDVFVRLLHFGHRIVAVVVGLMLLWTAREVWRRGSLRLRRTVLVGAGLFGAQVLVGGLNIFTDLHTASVTVHLSTSVAIWGTLVVAWGIAQRTPALRVEQPSSGLRFGGLLRRRSVGDPAAGSSRSKVAAYIALTKPRIIELLLVTTVPTMVIAQGGWPSTWLVVATVVGGTLAAGGANAVNMYVDRDIDRLMERTQGRPLVTGEIADPRHALVFALTLEAAAFAWLWGFVNLLSAVLALSATLFYVFVYTLWLKRTSTQNIVIGGAAGAVPVLVGWSAVTNRLELAPWLLFAVIFAWTPPHFWALAIRYRNDYQAADVPMLPAVASLPTVARKVLAYTVVVWVITLAFWSVAGMGQLYLGAAIVLGAVFTWQAAQLVVLTRSSSVTGGPGALAVAGGGGTAPTDVTSRLAMRLFGWSITYLTLLFGAMAADTLLLA